MSVSKGFLDKLDKLVALSDEPCTCGDLCCKSCKAKDLLESIRIEIESFLFNNGDI